MDTRYNLKEYFLWMCMFVPWLYLISPAHRSGYGFSTHVAALMMGLEKPAFLLHTC